MQTAAAPENIQNNLTEVIRKYDQGRDHLIPMLQEIQDKISFLPPEAITMVANHLGLSENDVYGGGHLLHPIPISSSWTPPDQGLSGNRLPCTRGRIGIGCHYPQGRHLSGSNQRG